MIKFLAPLITIILLISIIAIQNSDAANEKKSEPITMEGYFNILVIDYLNGTSSEEYYLFVDTDKNRKTLHKLEFEKIPSNLSKLSGHDVKVKGQKNPKKDAISRLAYSELIGVESISLSQQTITQAQSTISQNASRPVPSPLKTVAILLKYSDFPDEQHPKSNFENVYFNSTYSLSTYWNVHSYGALTIDGNVTNWTYLPQTQYYYTQSSNFAGTTLGDGVAVSDPQIDFDGPDNIIQNNNAANLMISGDNGDDVDSLILVFNQYLDCIGCAFAWTSPVPISTNEGTLYVTVSWIPDVCFGVCFVDPSYQDGYGITAHEMGHNFGWSHTPPLYNPSDPYADPWSIMSGNNDGIGPPGIISVQKTIPGWIPSNDMITVNPGQVTFTLDVLSVPSSGPNYLMGIIPYGPDNRIYTLEARNDSPYDHTPMSQMGLLVYEVDGCGEGCLVTNAFGSTYNDTAHQVSITYLSSNATSITIKVNNNASLYAPIANDDFVTMNEDTIQVINVLANDTDPDDGIPTITSVTTPSNGIAILNANQTITYTPNPNFYGTDSFVYTASDSYGWSDTAAVTISVNPINDPPVTNDDYVTTNEDTALGIDVLANDNDPDGQLLLVISVTLPITSYSGVGSWLSLYTNPDDADSVNILGLRLNNAFDIGSFRWNGSAYTNYGDIQITSDTTVITYEAYSLDFRR